MSSDSNSLASCLHFCEDVIQSQRMLKNTILPVSSTSPQKEQQPGDHHDSQNLSLRTSNKVANGNILQKLIFVCNIINIYLSK